MSTRELSPGDEREAPLTSSESPTVTVPADAQAGDTDPTEPTEDAKSYHRIDQAGNHGRGDSLGRYLVLDRIGEGGMGAVYVAYDPELDRRVAVKLLRTARARQNSRKRLVREARALAKLSHPNVVQVYDAGEHQGNVFVAMELVAGDSLKEWVQSEPAPPWQELLAAYLEAARGLAAAHENGLVHRDVKPSNLLRGKDGRVRVADFGLAAAAQRDTEEISNDRETSRHIQSSQSSLEGSLHERLTMTGSIMGTPVYMAPEQHLSADVGPAADQYSLCVSLYEALYGQLPFQSVKKHPVALAELMHEKLHGEVLPPAPDSSVPAWVFQALRRGLRSSPEERYSSMSELISALASHPGRQPRARWRMAMLGCGAALLATLAVLGWSRSGVFDDACEPAQQQRLLAGAWDKSVQARIDAALQATGKPYAKDTAARVSAALTAYAAEWVAMHAEVCRAHQARPAERALLSLRSVCLERRRSQLQALTEVLGAGADNDVLSRAVTAVRGLYPISYCADSRALTARLPPPEDPALRARVEALQPRVDRLEALHGAGKYREGLAEAERLRSELTHVAHPPLLAEAAYWLARMRIDTGDYDGALPLVNEAMFLASQGADDILAAKAWAILLTTVGDGQKRMDEVKRLADGVSMVAAHTRDDRARAFLLNNVAGSLLSQLGRFDDAKAVIERVLTIREKVLGPEHPDVADSLNTLANIYYSSGKYTEARPTYEHSLAIREKVLGPEHPRVADSLNNLANTLISLGKHEEAIALLERALAIRERGLGPDHPSFMAALNNLANALHGMGRYEEAKATHERAVAAGERTLGPEHPDIANPLNNLARTLAAMGNYAEAKALIERTVAIREKSLGPEHPRLAASLANLANVLYFMGTYAEAKALHERAVAIQETVLGPDHTELAGTLNALANVLHALGAQSEAAARYERSLAIYEKALGADHPKVIPPLMGLGRLLIAEDSRSRDIERGERYLQRALVIGERALAPKAPQWEGILLGLGELALARQTPQDAIVHLERALAMSSPEYQVDIQLALAEAQWLAAGESTAGSRVQRDARARAVDLARQAREHCRAVGHAPKRAKAERWLAAHLLP